MSFDERDAMICTLLLLVLGMGILLFLFSNALSRMEAEAVKRGYGSFEKTEGPVFKWKDVEK